MVFTWGSGSASSDVGELLAKRQYARAAQLLKQQLELIDRPALRQQLADVLVLDGRTPEALPLLEGLADHWGREGYSAKAIAVLKKIQRLDPDRPGVAERLDALARDPGRVFSPPTGPPPAVVASAPLPSDRVPPLAAVGLPETVAPGVPVKTPSALPASVTRTSLFVGLSPDELAALIAGLSLRSFEPGDVLVTEGEPGDSLFLVVTGAVKVFVRDREGRNRRVRALGEGMFFGEVSVLRGVPRTATVTAAGQVDLLELTRRDLDAIAVRHPRVRDVMESFLALRLGSAAEKESRRETFSGR